MNSISWPNIFKSNSTVVDNSYEATKKCIHLLLSTEKGELFGDPEFGIRLKRYTFEQNNYVLRDILIDEIYNAISTFIPQVTVKRNNIKIVQQGKKLYASIPVIYKVDFTTDMYNIELYNTEEV